MRYRDNQNRRSYRDPRAAEIPRLHRGRRALRDRDACGVGRGLRDRGGEPMQEEAEDELDDRPLRSRRSRKYNRAPLNDRVEMARTRRALRELPGRPSRSRMSADRDDEPDDMMDLVLDAILEVPEDEIESDLPEGEMGEEPAECPVGCVPESAVDEILEEEAKEEEEEGEEKGDEDKDEDKDDEKEEKEDKKEASVGVNTSKWAPLFSEADVQRLGPDAEVMLIPFLNQADPSYVALANGTPVGEIRESDLTKVDPEDRHALFVAEQFPMGIVQAAEQLGAANVLNDLGLRYYANLVTQRQADAAAKTAVQADMEDAFQTRAADLKQRFINNVLLAVEASNKNVFMDNPLREAVRVNFREAGVPDAVVVDLFEDAMQKAGSAYFLAMVEKADEWLGFEKDAMQQIEATIRQANYVHPADRGLQIEASLNQPPAPVAPLRTMQAPPQQRDAGTSEWESAEQQLRSVLRQAGTLRRGRNS